MQRSLYANLFPFYIYTNIYPVLLSTTNEQQ